MLANEEHPTSYYELHISGENADAVSVQQSDGGYLISGTDMREVTVHALNDSQELSLSFSTDADRVLVYETDSHTLAVSADLDKDGTFETVLTSGTVLNLGDVNGDGSINAEDAAWILRYASAAGTASSPSRLEEFIKTSTFLKKTHKMGKN